MKTELNRTSFIVEPSEGKEFTDESADIFDNKVNELKEVEDVDFDGNSFLIEIYSKDTKGLKKQIKELAKLHLIEE